ncbi:hypothetical protein DAPPUDRAFT_301570 [Daphnia pulex]|uniref:Uncharacterized protein n=1 Tax=Daphnia pulex TaxID=6669 RepID=E9GA01_DAPPU|nr:hypothetical protein DAPPUDRAFT_301570 [Daphnia pulex]|eukprot:EFX83657.1 hypothetical protein DAPPUDRAFT_301570 [Daphnia pulex]
MYTRMIEMNIWRENKKQKKLFHHVIQQSHALGRHPSKNFSLGLPGRQKSPSNRLYESPFEQKCLCLRCGNSVSHFREKKHQISCPTRPKFFLFMARDKIVIIKTICDSCVPFR